MPGTYHQEISATKNLPSCLIVLLDQSGLMAEQYGADKRTKAVVAARAANIALDYSMARCVKAESVRDYFHVGVIGYSGVAARDLFVGGSGPAGLLTASEVQCQAQLEEVEIEADDGSGKLKVAKQIKWIDHVCTGAAPMDKAFELATRKMEEWVTKYPNSYPPVVLNISGGVPNDPEAAEHAAQALRQVSTSDGDALLYNCCFSQWGFPIEFPNYEEVLPDIVSKWFFRISSEIPEPVAADARFCGYQQVLKEGSRGLFATPEALMRFLFRRRTPCIPDK